MFDTLYIYIYIYFLHIYIFLQTTRQHNVHNGRSACILNSTPHSAPLIHSSRAATSLPAPRCSLTRETLRHSVDLQLGKVLLLSASATHHGRPSADIKHLINAAAKCICNSSRTAKRRHQNLIRAAANFICNSSRTFTDHHRLRIPVPRHFGAARHGARIAIPLECHIAYRALTLGAPS